ncbi:hypothetical protein JXA85_02160 [Candidatus Woesearchaeota archaeon]|nr:hypothetical protein [Candidatus Woesearchaeota archaeon]
MRDCVLCKKIERGNVLYRTPYFEIITDPSPVYDEAHRDDAHLLIYSRKHSDSGMARLKVYQLDDLLTNMEVVRRVMYRAYSKPVTFFEHGSSTKDNPAGSSVVHPHMHCVSRDLNMDEIICRNAALSGKKFLLIPYWNCQKFLIRNSLICLSGKEMTELVVELHMTLQMYLMMRCLINI